MREIKFRYIIKTDKGNILTLFYDIEDIEEFDMQEKILEDINGGCDGNATCASNGFCECSPDYEDFEILARNLFTNLPDKNGKEIYEGDILKIKIGSRINHSQVIWKDHIVRNDYEGQYANLNGYVTFGQWVIKSIDGGMTLAMHEGNFEVIGNIYENENLLTSNN